MNLIIFFLLLILITIIVAIIVRMKELPDPVRLSVRESLDKIPEGILFATKDGDIILNNGAMEKIWHDLTGQPFLPNAKMMWTALCLKSIPGYRSSSREIFLLFTLSGDRFFRFSMDNLVSSDNEEYIQILAVDVSELVQTKTQIENDTLELESQKQRLSNVLNGIVEIAKEEEILNQKILVHEKLGSALLQTKVAVSSHNEGEIDASLSLWESIINGLTVSLKEADQVKNRSRGTNLLSELMEVSTMLNVNFKIEGNLPQNKEVSYTISLLANEAITNAVRHGKATEVTMKIYDKDGIKVVTSNNGKPANSEIREGGGLSSIRERIEKTGGTLEIYSKDRVSYVAFWQDF
ncbi:MAG: hypothetical protein MJ134_06800 [Lachnospiraceae bacterium]|nr:hypothetical protein [Lachnospiraceae bacterium]